MDAKQILLYRAVFIKKSLLLGKLLVKTIDSNKKAVVLCADKDSMSTVDDYLWTSVHWLPHYTIDDELYYDSPVVITSKLNDLLKKEFDYLILYDYQGNLDHYIEDDFTRFIILSDETNDLDYKDITMVSENYNSKISMYVEVSRGQFEQINP